MLRSDRNIFWGVLPRGEGLAFSYEMFLSPRLRFFWAVAYRCWRVVLQVMVLLCELEDFLIFVRVFKNSFNILARVG